MPNKDDALAVIATFLVQLVEDRSVGAVRPLSEYQSRFPGFEELIAEEFEREAAQADEDASHPLRIGRYEIEREIGRGGQGVVYAAIDPTLHRRVALKMLTGIASESPTQRERLRREAEALSRLEHPNLCHVYEMSAIDGVPFIVMQYVEGAPLTEFLEAARQDPADRAPLDIDSTTSDGSISAGTKKRGELLAIAAKIEQVARALHAAHQAGLVHRDVKPGNIMLTTDGTPVLLDFGLAHDAEDAGLSLTRTGWVMGTPAYMAPEQLVAEHDRADPRTDVYALAVTLFEALTLERPFQGPTREALFHAIQFDEPPHANRRNPAVPTDLARVIAVGMEKEPAKRYESAEAFADDLARVRNGEPILARPPSTIVRGIRWFRRRPAIAALAVAFAAAAVLGGYLLANLGNIDDARRARDLAKARRGLDAAFFLYGEQQWAPAAQGFRPLIERDDRIGAEAAAGLTDCLIRLNRLAEARKRATTANLLRRFPILQRRLVQQIEARSTARPTKPGKRWARIKWTPTTREDFAPARLDEADPFELFMFSQENLPDRPKQLEQFAVPREAIDRAIALALRPRAIYYGGKANILARANGPVRECRIIADTLVRRWPERADSWFYRGLLLGTAGSADESYAAYEQAIKLNPDHMSARFNTAQLSVRHHQYDPARKTLEEAIANGLGRASAVSMLGSIYLHLQRTDDAERLITEALAKWPDSAELVRTRGLIALVRGKPNAALTDLRTAADAEPYVTAHLTHLAHAYWLLKRDKDARQIADRALSLERNNDTLLTIAMAYQVSDPAKAHAAAMTVLTDDPASPLAHMVLAQIAVAEEDWTRAIKHARRALETAIEKKSIYRHLGDSLCNLERRAEGLEAYRKAFALDESDGDVLYTIALTLGDLERWPEAKETCERALRLAPTLAKAHSLLGTLLDRMGDTDASIAAYQRGVDAVPDDGELLYNLATALQGADRHDEARRAFERAIRAEPGRASAQYNYGLLLVDEESWRAAKARFARAVEIDPNHHRAWQQLGYSAQKLCEWSPACDAYERALTLGEPARPILMNLAQCRLRAGHVERALKVFRRVRRLDPSYAGSPPAKRWEQYVVGLIRTMRKYPTLGREEALPDDGGELASLAALAGMREAWDHAADLWVRVDSGGPEWDLIDSFYAARDATLAAFAPQDTSKKDDPARRSRLRSFALERWRAVLRALEDSPLRGDVAALLRHPTFVRIGQGKARAGVSPEQAQRWRRLVRALQSRLQD